MHRLFDKRITRNSATTVFSAPSEERIKTLRLSIIKSLFRYHPRVKSGWKGPLSECIAICGDVNGRLDVYGLANLLRERLKMHADEMTNEEIEYIFYIIDGKKKEGKITEKQITDFLQYEEAPYEGVEDIDNHKQHLRTLRIKRNFQLACRSLGVGEEFIKKAFYAYDKDGSGTLSFSEFRAGLRFDLKISRWDMKEADVAYMFKILDQDHSGNVEVEELVSFLSEGMKKGEQKMGVSESMRDISLLWNAVESGETTVPRSIRYETPVTMSATPKGLPSAAELLARKRRCLSRSFSWTSLSGSDGRWKHFGTTCGGGWAKRSGMNKGDIGHDSPFTSYLMPFLNKVSSKQEPLKTPSLPLFAIVPFLQSSEATALYIAFGEPQDTMPLVHLVDITGLLAVPRWSELQLLQTLKIGEDQLVHFNYFTLPNLRTATIFPTLEDRPGLDLCPLIGRFLTPKLKTLNLKGFCCDMLIGAIESVEEWPPVEKLIVSHDGASCQGSSWDLWEAISFAFPGLTKISAVPSGTWRRVNGDCQLTMTKRQIEFMPKLSEIEVKGPPPAFSIGNPTLQYRLTSLSITDCFISPTVINQLWEATSFPHLRRLSFLGPTYGSVGSALAMRLTQRGFLPVLECLSLHLTKWTEFNDQRHCGIHTDIGMSFLRILVQLYETGQIPPHPRLRVVVTNAVKCPTDGSVALLHDRLGHGVLPKLRVLKIKAEDGRYRIFDSFDSYSSSKGDQVDLKIPAMLV